MKRRLSLLVLTVGSCVLLNEQRGPKACEVSRCALDDLIACQSNIEVTVLAACAGGADLTAADLSNADLSGGDFSFANFRDADLSGADLTNANLSSAALLNTTTLNADLTGADLTTAQTGQLQGCPAALPNAQFSCAELPNAGGLVALFGPFVDLSGAALTGADLAAVIMTNANLTNADLSAANLVGAEMSNTNLDNLNLNAANLTNANLSNANLNNAELSNANLTGVIGVPINANTATFGNTTCPTGVNSDAANNTCIGQGF